MTRAARSGIAMAILCLAAGCSSSGTSTETQASFDDLLAQHATMVAQADQLSRSEQDDIRVTGVAHYEGTLEIEGDGTILTGDVYGLIDMAVDFAGATEVTGTATDFVGQAGEVYDGQLDIVNGTVEWNGFGHYNVVGQMVGAIATEAGPPISVEGDLITDFYGSDMQVISDAFAVEISSAGTVREVGVEIVAFEVE